MNGIPPGSELAPSLTTAPCSRRTFLAGLGSLLLSGTACRPSSPTPAPGEQPREAQFYTKLKNRNVQCRLCPRECIVAPGERGFCRVRENRNGTYYSLVYGYPVAVHLDPIEKKPFFHVYPGSKAFSIATVGCNLRCRFCQNWEISQATPDQIKRPYVSPEQVALAARKSGAKTIAYTYSEPTIFCEYMIDCAKAGNAIGIDSVIVSNGFISARAQAKLLPHLKAVKVDLKAFTEDFYATICGGHLQPVLRSLKRIVQSGTWLEIVVLVIPTLNDSPDEIRRMAAWIVQNLGPNVPIHFIPFRPMYKLRNLPPTSQELLRRARTIAMAEGCHFAYGGDLPDGSHSNTFCPECGALAVDRYHYSIDKVTDGICGQCGAALPGVWK